MLSIINVYFRDVSILWNTITPALFYLTPIAFTIDIVPVKYQWILKANPLFHFFKAARDILYSNTVPSLTTWLYIIGLTLVSVFLGRIAFKKLRRGLISNI
jgi:ABC-type polysaccharide/polyol phosphate export permease